MRGKFATAAIVGALLLGVATTQSEANDATALRARSCGHMEFKPDPYGAGGLITARGVRCKGARRVAKKCLKNGKKPSGWKVRYVGGKVVFKRRHAKINVQLAGAAPPGMGHCLN